MNSSRSYSLAALPRLLYTQNPFYLISALLVLYGIYVALGPESGMGGGWLLLGLLGGYTLALTLAGLVIVRFGQVWDDAPRSCWRLFCCSSRCRRASTASCSTIRWRVRGY